MTKITKRTNIKITEMLESSDEDIKADSLDKIFKNVWNKWGKSLRNQSLNKQICFKEPNGNLNWKKNNNQKKSSEKGLNSRMEEEIFNGLKDRKTETTQSEKLRDWGGEMGGVEPHSPKGL